MNARGEGLRKFILADHGLEILLLELFDTFDDIMSASFEGMDDRASER
jgi:hypothetical protein